MTRVAVVLAASALVAAAGVASAQPQVGWEVRIPERVDVVPGETGTLAIAVAVDRGLTVSKDAPVIVDLAPPKGVSVRRRRVGRGEAVDPEADAPRFAIGVRGDEPGEHVLKLRLRFWLCATRTCRPIDVRRTATIVVATPGPPPTDAGT